MGLQKGATGLQSDERPVAIHEVGDRSLQLNPCTDSSCTGMMQRYLLSPSSLGSSLFLALPPLSCSIRGCSFTYELF